MKRPEEKIQEEKLQLVQTATIPVHDYRPALQDAVSWLGERYLLAEPVTRRNDDRKAYYLQSRRWHPATRH